MPQHLLGQLGLPITQPGLLLQTRSAGFLRREGGAVTLRKVEQIPATDVGQQATDPSDEQQIKADAHDGRATDLFVARDPQLLLGVDNGFKLFADFIGQALAAPRADRATVIPTDTLQIDQ
ncbi:hypothetical protein D3C84_384900 [compost metagenome]